MASTKSEGVHWNRYSGNIFVFPLWVEGNLNLCLFMMVNAKKELVFQVIAEMRKRPKTVQMQEYQTLG